MKKTKNRERILQASVELFNQSGVVAVTTNHIAEHLGISPGNLYFHFRNKEEIIRELFELMCADTYKVWKPTAEAPAPGTPLELIERSYVVFWNYRFFHREMYHLRRRDSILTKNWKTHITKTIRLLQTTYGHWVKEGLMKKISDPREMQLISDTVLITSSSFLLFFESKEKPATKKSIRAGVHHLARFLHPYHTERIQKQLETYLAS